MLYGCFAVFYDITAEVVHSVVWNLTTLPDKWGRPAVHGVEWVRLKRENGPFALLPSFICADSNFLCFDPMTAAEHKANFEDEAQKMLIHLLFWWFMRHVLQIKGCRYLWILSNELKYPDQAYSMGAFWEWFFVVLGILTILFGCTVCCWHSH